jgi:hypothetical protein
MLIFTFISLFLSSRMARDLGFLFLPLAPVLASCSEQVCVSTLALSANSVRVLSACKSCLCIPAHHCLPPPCQCCGKLLELCQGKHSFLPHHHHLLLLGIRWFHPHVSGKEAEKLLLECGYDGAFLVSLTALLSPHHVINSASLLRSAVPPCACTD